MKRKIPARFLLCLLVLAGPVSGGGLVLLFGTTPRYVQGKLSDVMWSERLYASLGEAERAARLAESSKFRQPIADRVNAQLGDRWFQVDDMRIEATVQEAWPSNPAFATHRVGYDVSIRTWAKTDLLNIRSLKETILHDGPAYAWSEETDAANTALREAVGEAIDEL